MKNILNLICNKIIILFFSKIDPNKLVTLGKVTRQPFAGLFASLRLVIIANSIITPSGSPPYFNQNRP